MAIKEDLIEQKKRVDLLSMEAKKSYELLMQLCNEIYFAEKLSSNKNCSSEADNLIYVLTERIVNHLDSIRSLLSAYEKFFEVLEESIPQIETKEGYE